MPTQDQLSERELRVLEAVVQTYIETAEPTGSQTIARKFGLGDVPLLCARELSIRHGNPRTVRILVHCYSRTPRADLRHVYLHHAKHLRDDLSE